MATIINYNVTDFNQLEWNGAPYGDNTDRVIAIVQYDNGYKTTIVKSPTIEPVDLGLYDIDVINSNSVQLQYRRLSESGVTDKLLEIQNL